MTFFKTLGSAVLAVGLLAPTSGFAAGESAPLIDKSWPFEGILGHFDKASAQRGYQVYEEVCAGCHSLDYVAFRNLQTLGFSEDEVKAIAAQYEVVDGPDDEGEYFDRTARASDYFPAPYPNDEASRASNGGALPPDLSLIVKARANGADYVYSLLTGYEEEMPEDIEDKEDLNYNPYFPGGFLAMAQPLYGGDVTYADGSEPTIEQQAEDLVNFLMFAAEPQLEERKGTGLSVMLFLFVLTGLLYAVKRRVWSDLH